MAINTTETDLKIAGQMRNWSIALGIGMIILGLLTISSAAFTTFFTILFLGIVLAVRGVIDMVTAFVPHHGKSFFWGFFGGILSLAVGILIVSRPGVTAAALTYLLAAFLIILGLFKTIAAPMEREAQWGWVMFSGIITLIFGVWIISLWPEVSLFLIGLFVGIEILVQGIIMVSLPYVIIYPEKHGGGIYAH